MVKTNGCDGPYWGIRYMKSRSKKLESHEIGGLAIDLLKKLPKHKNLKGGRTKFYVSDKTTISKINNGFIITYCIYKIYVK